MITNKQKMDSALASRVRAININFTDKEFITSIEKMLKFINPTIPLEIKKEVFAYLEECYINNPDINIDFRLFSAMVDMRIAYPENWKDLSKNILYLNKKKK
jgi:hypothetical protein